MRRRCGTAGHCERSDWLASIQALTLLFNLRSLQTMQSAHASGVSRNCVARLRAVTILQGPSESLRIAGVTRSTMADSADAAHAEYRATVVHCIKTKQSSTVSIPQHPLALNIFCTPFLYRSGADPVDDDILWSLEGVPCVGRTAFEQKVPSTIGLSYRSTGQRGWRVSPFFICTIKLA